jgi:hypothetical protein
MIKTLKQISVILWIIACIYLGIQMGDSIINSFKAHGTNMVTIHDAGGIYCISIAVVMGSTFLVRSILHNWLTKLRRPKLR